MVSTGEVRHPLALYILFFTGMWERFGYYLMLGILFMYLTDTASGGMGLATSVGNKLSEVLASLYDTCDHKANFFLINFAACTVAD
jgi:dipeptide/tripeptide permease